jgi:hypothetical protein
MNYPENYASLYVKDRETLLLIRVQQPATTEDFPVYIPLLKSKEKDFDYIANLNRKTIEARHDSHRSRRVSQAGEGWSRGTGNDAGGTAIMPRRTTSVQQPLIRRPSTNIRTNRSVSVFC